VCIVCTELSKKDTRTFQHIYTNIIHVFKCMCVFFGTPVHVW